MSHRSWKIARRTMLRGVGAAMALPFLEQMVDGDRRARAQTELPLRYLGICMPNGVHQNSWRPSETGSNYTLTRTLQPLSDVKDDILIVSGLTNQIAEQHDIGSLHYGGVAGLLTCVKVYASESTSRVARSIDQHIANGIPGGDVAFPSLQLGLRNGTTVGTGAACGFNTPCVYGREMSWADVTTPMFKETRARAAFDRLFGRDVEPSTPSSINKRAVYDRSVLDIVQADARRLQAKLGRADNLKLDEYMSSVRALELRIPAAGDEPGEAGRQCMGTRPDAELSYSDHIRAMYEIIALAFQCDATRVATFLLGEAETDYVFRSELGQVDVWHEVISHHGNNQNRIAQLDRIIEFQFQHFVTFLNRLKGMREPDGSSVFDRSAIFFSSDVSDGQRHSFNEMPVIVAGRAGGSIAPGRHLRFPNTPLANLHRSMARAVGVPVTTFGNATGELTLT